MPPEIKHLAADVRNLPIADSDESFQDRSATIGDLDGNFLNALHFLVKTHCMTISEEDWNKFITIYNKLAANISIEDLEKIEAILDKIKLLETPLKPTLLRFIGDTLADKEIMGAKHDGITFLIYQWLKKSGLPYEVLISNHDLEAIYGMRGNETPRIADEHRQSWTVLKHLMDKDESIEKKYQEIFTTAYLPSLKLFSYETNEQYTEIHILSHAPSSISAIGYAARNLRVLNQQEEITGKTVRELTDLIDKINNAFELIVQNQSKLEEFNARFGAISNATERRLIFQEDLDSNDLFCESNKSVKLSFGCGHLGAKSWENIANKSEKKPDGKPDLERIEKYYHNYDAEKGVNYTDGRGSTDQGRILAVGDCGAKLSPAPGSLPKSSQSLSTPIVAGWAVVTVFAVITPVGVPYALGAAFLVSLATMWPVMLGIAAGSLITGVAVYTMHERGIFKPTQEKLGSLFPSLGKN